MFVDVLLLLFWPWESIWFNLVTFIWFGAQYVRWYFEYMVGILISR